MDGHSELPAPAAAGKPTAHFFASLSHQTPTTARDSQAQHVPAMDEKLSFFQKHFTKPIDRDPEKFFASSNRRFSPLSTGCLLLLSLVLVLLFGIVATAVAVTQLNHQRQSSQPTRPSYGTSGQPGQPNLPPSNGTKTNSPPVHMAIFDNFPDPALWFLNGVWYAFGTNSAAGILQNGANTTRNVDLGLSNVQLATSTDFVNWTLQESARDPLPTVGAWSVRASPNGQPAPPRAAVWAPALTKRKDGKCVLYYSAVAANVTNPSTHHPPPHCVGAAVSRTDSPAGPYDPLRQPLACPIDKGGAIDPAPFFDKDGTLYVTYKVDGNNLGNGGACGNTVRPIQQTPIVLQKMADDATTPVGDPVTILDRSDSDGPLVEAPQIVRSHEGVYFLFFSAGCTRTPQYQIRYATANDVTGPYTRAQYPLLQTGDWGLLAPGSAGLHDDGRGGWNMAFHARVDAPQGAIRAMFVTKLQFSGSKVSVVGANSTTGS